ncbi:uncharacterized protein DUF664 [Glutamicibacter mysorens]|uniref:Uncharacterized protein DUF664 n=1 Tax=Glutamicibacter mysorens TaxID=257984 RepID=A0ABX4MV40_9MICC|nr:DUF664 domain-containing protein [Glutamicibacter mysorens]PJJ43150.1 uncharacterized protein DUF664 [Glutamicibacter mysorens]
MESPAPGEQILTTLLLEKFDQLTEALASIPPEQANSLLPVQGSNSPVQLMLHCCGMMRRWSSTVNLGVEVPRDRAAEFTAVMDKEAALQLASDARKSFVNDLALTAMHDAPIAAPPGRDSEYWMATCEGVLMHVLEELCQHLGHLEITRDVLNLPAC